ncbi:MAG: hypothetical protein EU544_00875 [Promethearchaeota archaeon]|nr:MAG: hypothetical protein EU544_00875 [Candidatus Lokiarchaeota archaeon]
MLEFLDEMFDSETIKPSFEYVHIVLALYIFGKQEEGMGRYRLQKELEIGSGTARSLITKLKEKMEFLTVLGDNNRKGHILTQKGAQYLTKLKTKIPLLEPVDIGRLKDIIIEPDNNKAYICVVCDASEIITSGITQRDAAIKIGGLGATCLIYEGEHLRFPVKSFSAAEQAQLMVEEPIQSYFETIANENESALSEGDVIIIGLGETSKLARLSAMNAALTLIT